MFTRTDRCAQVSAVSTHHSERYLDDIRPGDTASHNEFLYVFPSYIFFADRTSHELSDLAAYTKVGKESHSVSLVEILTVCNFGLLIPF